MGPIARFARDVFPWMPVGAATAMLLLMLIPAEVWHHPENDAVYSGFDPNLIYVSLKGGTPDQLFRDPDGTMRFVNPKDEAYSEGSVQVEPQALTITALPNSRPTVHLLTTPLNSFNASMDLRILESSVGAEPLRIGVWSLWTLSGFFLTFGPPPENLVTALTISNGESARSLEGGTVTKSEVLGTYALGVAYHLEMTLDRQSGVMAARLSGLEEPGRSVEAETSAQEAPDLFESRRVSFTAVASSQDGIASAALENYSLTLKHQRWWAAKTDDPRVTIAVLSLVAAGALVLVVQLARWLRRLHYRRLIRHAVLSQKRGLIAAAGAAFYLVLNAVLFGLGYQSFDMPSEKVWSHVAASFGPAELYYLANVVSVAEGLDGIPVQEAVFPYGAVMAYVFTAIGWLYRGLGQSGVDAAALEFLIKAVNGTFALADGALIYLILRRVGETRRSSLVACCVWLFNPAVLFAMSIWGQTHVISLFFPLAALWLIEKRRVQWAWLALAAATLTRPQILVLVLMLGVVALRKFSLRENVTAIAWSVVIVFLSLAPLTLSISPSLPVDILVNQFLLVEGTNEAASVVSLDAYSLWPLVTLLAEGARKMQLLHYPAGASLAGPLTYSTVSQVLLLGFIIATGFLLGRRSRSEQGGYFPLLAIGIFGFLMLQTGIAAMYFVLLFPFLLLCKRYFGKTLYYSAIVVLTITTLVPLYGSLGLSILGANYVHMPLHPFHNSGTLVALVLYSSSPFIILASICNLALLTCLVIASRGGFRAVRAEAKTVAESADAVAVG